MRVTAHDVRLSYAGEVRIGVAADALRLADPAALVRRMEAEIALLESAG